MSLDDDDVRWHAKELIEVALEEVESTKGLATLLSHVSVSFTFLGTGDPAQAHHYLSNAGISMSRQYKYGSKIRTALEKFHQAVLNVS